MKRKTTSSSMLAVLFAAVIFHLAGAEILFTFDDPVQFDADFPVGIRSLTGTSTVTLETSPERVRLLATNEVSSAKRSAIYSAATYGPELDFSEEEKTVSFHGVTMLMTAGGLTYRSAFGLSRTAGGALPAADDAIYFLMERNDDFLKLVQTANGSDTVLDSWEIHRGSEDGVLSYTFESLFLTLDGSSWTVSGTAVGEDDGIPISGNGELAEPIDWDGDYYLGMQAWDSGTNTERWAALEVESISVSDPAPPEPFSLEFQIEEGQLMLFWPYREGESWKVWATSDLSAGFELLEEDLEEASYSVLLEDAERQFFRVSAHN